MGMIDYIKMPSRRMLLRGEMPAWIANSPRAPYIISVVLSAPEWVDRKALRALKALAATMTKATGNLHVVDHIIPLNHPRVCGLTVPWNLRVITAKANMAKSNNWCPEQQDLFGDTPEFMTESHVGNFIKYNGGPHAQDQPDVTPEHRAVRRRAVSKARPTA